MNGVDAGTATSDTPASALRPPSPQRTPMTERTAADAVMRRRPFRLLRYFSVASLIGLVAVTAALLWAYRALAEHHLVQHETRANAELTRAFSNGVWARYRGFVAESVGKRREQLLADPAIADLRADVLSNMRGLAVVKVKVYNIDGLTVFSTEDRQIGEIKRDNLGFTQAMAGLPVGAITHRDKFDAFEGVISNRDLIASYVPIQVSTGAPVEGVFEVYSDVTALLEKQRSAQWQVAALVLVLLSALYLFLLGVVRKADRVILSQESERAEREALVVHQAHHDALTGLPNRAYFAERLTEAISRSGRYGHACALMYIDLDRFKFVNDSLGHQAGDELLRVVAERIAGCLRDSDLLFRMGGDEFTVILSRISESEDAASIARRITAAVAEPLMLREHEINIGATAGIAVYPADGTSADALVKNADAAMYSAKKAGRGRHAFYSSDMNERAMRRLELETALKQGFRDGEFKLYYQPRLSALDRRIVAFEALLRWAPPGRPVVLPDEFVPVLEDIGMMPIVGEWMLRSACAQSVQWRIEGQPPRRVSVNVSPAQFQRANFVGLVERVLRETGADPSQIELELTESTLIADVAQTVRSIAALKTLGLNISIDDFGTGLSSLNYLRHLEVDFIKIDRSFVSEITANPRDRALAGSIIQLAKALGIAVVAEGVESEAQASFFKGADCAELQGILFCQAVPAGQLRPVLAARDAEARDVLQTGPDSTFARADQSASRSSAIAMPASPLTA
jgi:diguanylate cyclase (GGDEF)-like protein